MVDIDVRSDRAFWSTQIRRARIILDRVTAGGRGVVAVSHEVSVESAAEMHMLVDLLRNEKPIYFDRGSQSFETTKEPVGEGGGKSDHSWRRAVETGAAARRHCVRRAGDTVCPT